MVSKNICLNRGEKKRKTQRFSGAKKGHVMEEVNIYVNTVLRNCLVEKKSNEKIKRHLRL